MNNDRQEESAGRRADREIGIDGDRPNERPRLVHLSDASDLQVAKGDTDIRGWELRTADGTEIGTVEDLVVDTSLMRVRYIEGHLAADGMTDGERRRVLIPIESARLDENNDKVVIDYSLIDAGRLPIHDGVSMPNVDRDAESSMDERNFFGARRSGRETFPYIAPVNDPNGRDIDDAGTGLR